MRRAYAAVTMLLAAVVVLSIFTFTLNSQVNLLTNQKNQLETNLASSEAAASNLSVATTTLNGTVAALNQNTADLNSQIAVLQSRLASVTSTNNCLQSQLQNLNASYTAAEEAYATNITRMQNTVLSDQATITADESTINQLDSQVSNLESTLASWDAPVTDGFSIVQITDTQFLSESYPNLFNSLTSWIVNVSSALNVQMVVHTGDIVNNPANTSEWANANAAMLQLSNNGVPYCWCAGNHDFIGEQQPTGNPDGVWLGGAYSAFNVTAMQTEPYWVASIYNGSSTAVQFSYGGYRFMVINIAYDANQTTLTWMQTLLKCNPADNVIVATHNFLNGLGTYGYTPSAADVAWATNFESVLDDYPNIFMVLCGHDISEGTATSRVVNGRTEIFFNRQQIDNAQGGACARIYTFNMTNPTQPTVNVYTYQTYTNGSGGTPMYLTDPQDQFSFQTNLTAYAPGNISLSAGTVFVDANGHDVIFAAPISLTDYNQTGDTLSFSNLSMGDVAGNLTVSTTVNMEVTGFNSTTLTYMISGSGTQRFLLSQAPISVMVGGESNGWSYVGGVLTVTGAKETVTIQEA